MRADWILKLWISFTIDIRATRAGFPQIDIAIVPGTIESNRFFFSRHAVSVLLDTKTTIHLTATD